MASDKFSWRPLSVANIIEAEAKKNIDDFIFIELNSLQVSPILLDDPTSILADNYFNNS